MIKIEEKFHGVWESNSYCVLVRFSHSKEFKIFLYYSENTAQMAIRDIKMVMDYTLSEGMSHSDRVKVLANAFEQASTSQFGFRTRIDPKDLKTVNIDNYFYTVYEENKTGNSYKMVNKWDISTEIEIDIDEDEIQEAFYQGYPRDDRNSGWRKSGVTTGKWNSIRSTGEDY